MEKSEQKFDPNGNGHSVKHRREANRVKQPKMVAFDNFASVEIQLIGTEKDDFSIKISTREAQLFINIIEELLELTGYPTIPVYIDFKGEKEIVLDITRKQARHLVGNLKRAVHKAVEAN